MVIRMARMFTKNVLYLAVAAACGVMLTVTAQRILANVSAAVIPNGGPQAVADMELVSTSISSSNVATNILCNQPSPFTPDMFVCQQLFSPLSFTCQGTGPNCAVHVTFTSVGCNVAGHSIYLVIDGQRTDQAVGLHMCPIATWFVSGLSQGPHTATLSFEDGAAVPGGTAITFTGRSLVVNVYKARP